MVYAVIVAAGKGTRMGPNVDKMFLHVHGQPVVAHTWRCFDSAPCIDALVLVVRDGMQTAFEQLAASLHLTKRWRLVPGGAERQDSVWNGICALDSSVEVVAVQDAARPCTTHALIQATVDAARAHGAAVAAQPVTDTIKESADGQMVMRTLDRARLWAVQTPQTFQVPIIRAALQEVRRQGLNLTDDTAACEHIGQSVALVRGSSPNPKVTRPEDLPFIEMLLKVAGQNSGL